MTKPELRAQLQSLSERVMNAKRQETLDGYFNDFMWLISYLPEKDYKYISRPVNISKRLKTNGKIDANGLYSEINYAISLIQL